MTTPPPAPVPAPKPVVSGPLGWVEEHLIPGLKDIAKDAESARAVIPAVQDFLPKITAFLPQIAAALNDPALAAEVGPLVTEAEQILAVIAAL
jgi:hypothetical protein